MLIKASFIITREGPPLKDHAILIEKGLIKAIAPQKELKDDGGCLELPETILLPGLVNCHCHLELSLLPEPLPYPGSFTKWIEELGRLKLQITPVQTKEAIRFGIQKLIEGGTTTVADHVSIGTNLKAVMESPLDTLIYIEVLGIEEERAYSFYKQALEKTKNQEPRTKNKIIPTPHASYSLLPEIFSKVVLTSTLRHPSTPRQGSGQALLRTGFDTSTPLSIHLSESYEEYLLFKEKRGPLFDFLATKGKTPPTLGETPLQYLRRLNLLPPQTLAIHANYLEEEDIDILKERKMSVVHCPGSHAYFGHERFPLGMLQDGGINIALGTDSLASNPSLSMLEQMRLVLANYAELTPEMVLTMATLNGAKALGVEKEIGSLTVGKRANLVGIPLRYPKEGPYENILQAEKTSFTMIRGVL